MFIKGVRLTTFMTETITCECGLIVRGTSKDHANANLKLHRASRRHKEIMKIKELNKKENKRD